MERLHTESDLAPWAGSAFVPTMGALHDGHLALIRAAAASGRPVVVSVFVNPTQFDDPRDLEKYPRTLESDIARAADAGANAVFAPAVEVIYPPDAAVPVPPLPAVATEPGLEDAHRPGHFDGVAQVVARLFDLVRPAVAHFGEKDYQQLRVITELVAAAPERWPGLRIQPEPTIREPDGLAMSSRNVRLAPEDRANALGLITALRAIESCATPADAADRMSGILAAHNLAVDYATVRDALNLGPITDFSAPSRGLIAARAGTVRLIDNLAIPPRG